MNSYWLTVQYSFDARNLVLNNRFVGQRNNSIVTLALPVKLLADGINVAFAGTGLIRLLEE